MGLWLAVVSLLAFFHGLFTLAPLDKTEALQIGIAETMQRLHHWDVPIWNGHIYAEKPPLPYWLDALIWSQAGLVPELARLPSAIAATAGVASITWLVHGCWERELPQRRAWQQGALAGTLLALSPGWIAFGRTAVHDIYLALTVLLALASYTLGFGLVNGRSRPLAGALAIGLSCGFGFLAKGLLGIGLPLLIIAVDISLQPSSRREVLRPAVLALFGIGLLAVINPWLAALIHHRHWDYLQGFLGFSHLQRATQAVDGHDQPLLFYLPVMLGLLCPWWPLLWPALRRLWQQRHGWSEVACGSQRLQQLAGLWLVVGMALFTAIPTKLPGYILPLLPAAVVLIATADNRPRWSLRLIALQLGLLHIALLGTLIGSELGLLGSYGQLLQSGGDNFELMAAAILGLLAALHGVWKPQAHRLMPGLLISMLLLVSCLPALAKPYRQLEQQPVLELARAAGRLHGKADVLYVLGHPRYSVVAEAQLPTVFGSPLQPASPRPVSSYENWKRHTNDAEALVLGRCRSVQSLEREQAGQLTILEQHGRYCLGRLVRGASKP